MTAPTSAGKYNLCLRDPGPGAWITQPGVALEVVGFGTVTHVLPAKIGLNTAPPFTFGAWRVVASACLYYLCFPFLFFFFFLPYLLFSWF